MTDKFFLLPLLQFDIIAQRIASSRKYFLDTTVASMQYLTSREHYAQNVNFRNILKTAVILQDKLQLLL